MIPHCYETDSTSIKLFLSFPALHRRWIIKLCGGKGDVWVYLNHGGLQCWHNICQSRLRCESKLRIKYQEKGAADPDHKCYKLIQFSSDEDKEGQAIALTVLSWQETLKAVITTACNVSSDDKSVNDGMITILFYCCWNKLWNVQQKCWNMLSERTNIFLLWTPSRACLCRKWYMQAVS